MHKEDQWQGWVIAGLIAILILTSGLVAWNHHQKIKRNELVQIGQYVLVWNNRSHNVVVGDVKTGDDISFRVKGAPRLLVSVTTEFYDNSYLEAVHDGLWWTGPDPEAGIQLVEEGHPLRTDTVDMSNLPTNWYGQLIIEVGAPIGNLNLDKRTAATYRFNIVRQ